MNFDVNNRTILLVKHGSHAYGLNNEKSDLDLRGICIEPLEFTISCVNNFEQSIVKDEQLNIDSTVFGLKKFMKLALDSNPNVVEVLFVTEEEIIKVTDLGQKLIDNRDLFLSQKVYHTFGGYAKAQLKRLENHRRWIINPPNEPPSRQEYGLLEKNAISKQQLEAAFSMLSKKIDTWNCKDLTGEDFSSRVEILNAMSEIIAEIIENSQTTIDKVAANSIGFDSNFIEYINKEKSYQAKKEEYANYINWKNTRNKKRYETEEKCLCDTKHASHLIRLLYQSIDVLNGNGLNLKLDKEKRQILLDIKNGKFEKTLMNLL